MLSLIECAYFNIQFAYVFRLVAEQLGPVAAMSFVVILTRPYVRAVRRVMGVYW